MKDAVNRLVHATREAIDELQSALDMVADGTDCGDINYTEIFLKLSSDLGIIISNIDAEVVKTCSPVRLLGYTGDAKVNAYMMVCTHDIEVNTDLTLVCSDNIKGVTGVSQFTVSVVEPNNIDFSQVINVLKDKFDIKADSTVFVLTDVPDRLNTYEFDIVNVDIDAFASCENLDNAFYERHGLD